MYGIQVETLNQHFDDRYIHSFIHPFHSCKINKSVLTYHFITIGASTYRYESTDDCSWGLVGLANAEHRPSTTAVGRFSTTTNLTLDKIVLEAPILLIPWKNFVVSVSV